MKPQSYWTIPYAAAGGLLLLIFFYGMKIEQRERQLLAELEGYVRSWPAQRERINRQAQKIAELNFELDGPLEEEATGYTVGCVGAPEGPPGQPSPGPGGDA